MLKLFFQVVVSGSRGYGYYRKAPPPSGKCVLMVHIIRNERKISHVALAFVTLYELTLLMWFT